MAKSCDYEAIRVFISVNVGKYTNNAITVNYSDSVCATRHYHSTKITQVVDIRNQPWLHLQKKLLVYKSLLSD